MKLTDKQHSSAQRVLVFGAPKTGKTQLAGELAHYFNLIWFDLENGYATLLKLPREAQERINIISLPDTRSYPIAIETMLKVIKGGQVTICEAHGKVSCPKCKADNAETVTVHLDSLDNNTVVVIDSLTQLTNSAISHITKGENDEYKLTYDDWGNLGKLMDIILSHIQQAKYNVVCISHESEAEFEDGKKKIVPVAGTRNFSRNSAKYFDHVVYCELKNKKHAVGSATNYSMSILTGSRTDVKLEELASTSLVSIFKPELAVKAVAPTTTQTNSQGQQSAQNIAEKLAAFKAKQGEQT